MLGLYDSSSSQAIFRTFYSAARTQQKLLMRLMRREVPPDHDELIQTRAMFRPLYHDLDEFTARDCAAATSFDPIADASATNASLQAAFSSFQGLVSISVDKCLLTLREASIIADWLVRCETTLRTVEDGNLSPAVDAFNSVEKVDSQNVLRGCFESITENTTRPYQDRSQER